VETDTDRILAELESNDISSHPKGVESTNNVLDLNGKQNTVGVGRSLIISASILGSSMVISNIIPTLLECLLK
jgi:hypothetical protein